MCVYETVIRRECRKVWKMHLSSLKIMLATLQNVMISYARKKAKIDGYIILDLRLSD